MVNIWTKHITRCDVEHALWIDIFDHWHSGNHTLTMGMRDRSLWLSLILLLSSSFTYHVVGSRLDLLLSSGFAYHVVGSLLEDSCDQYFMYSIAPEAQLSTHSWSLKLHIFGSDVRLTLLFTMRIKQRPEGGCRWLRIMCTVSTSNAFIANLNMRIVVCASISCRSYCLHSWPKRMSLTNKIEPDGRWFSNGTQ